MSESLFERLGGEAGIRSIANDIVDLHIINPTIAARFANSDADRLKKMAADFFISGSGGPQIYEGKDMRSAHANMNISDEEYMAVVDDLITALDKNSVSDREKGEILLIFYSLRPDVVRV